ncbi:putative membrane protein [Thermoplasmatales archaeon SCGC AB-540-F20]|nr:putative membrane protein [Thermoplasmatales archaeon SCGC AB-540-F20]
MRHSLKTGFSFGLTSGIITTLGLIVGLHSGTHSRIVIIGGIITIAIADAFSDSIGIHICEESEGKHNTREIWESTISTLLSKFTFSISFILPILFLSLSTAIIISLIWGLSLIGIFSYYTAKLRKSKPWKSILEHLAIALLVIVITHYVGIWISITFN